MRHSSEGGKGKPPSRHTTPAGGPAGRLAEFKQFRCTCVPSENTQAAALPLLSNLRDTQSTIDLRSYAPGLESGHLSFEEAKEPQCRPTGKSRARKQNENSSSGEFHSGTRRTNPTPRTL